MDFPSISFTIATFNSSRTLEQCLASVKDQVYPSSIEIVIADGGSTDNTLEIAKSFGAKIINVPTNKQDAEYNKGVAVNNAKNEILVMIDHDNILPNKNWLKKMVKPLMDDEEIFGAGVLRFNHNKNLSLLDRYFALLGGTDPVPFFLNKSGHQSWLYEGFHLRGKLLESKSDYFVIELDPDSFPALGGNGALLRRKLLKEARSDPDHFFHIDIHHDLAKKGYVKYSFVKETIIHLTNNKLIPFLKRRKYFIEKYYFEDHSKRRYSIYEPSKDRLSLILFIIYAATFIGPLIDSFRGYSKIKDSAWFLHPFICFSMLILYGYPTVKGEIKRVLGR